LPWSRGRNPHLAKVENMDRYAPADQPESSNDASSGENAVTKTLLWIGVAGLSAALAYSVVRVLVARRPADETSRRIQHLIDEANSLLKTLDDQKHG